MKGSNRQNRNQKMSREQFQKTKLVDSIKMLTMSTLELEMALKQEISENPVLELDDDIDEEITISQKNSEDEDKTDEKETDDELSQTLQDAKELSEVLDSWNEYHSEHTTSLSQDHENDDDAPQFEKFVQADENFKLEYINQFDRLNLPENEFYFICDLIDSSNSYGFLPRTINVENNIDKEFDIYAIAKIFKINKKRADDLHQIILNASPKGITARSINESLYHQLEKHEQSDELLTNIILFDFNDLLQKKHLKIANKYNVSEEEVLECRTRIGRLDPKPGLRITSSKPQYIVPDVIVSKIGEDFEIIINDFNMPRISLSRRYYNILKELQYDKDAINYVKDKINSAKFLIRSVFMRHKTLERVMRSIINHQSNFFYHQKSLEPLTYAVVAAELDLNESTVSRVVRSKYADTSYGVYCLRDFFCTTAGKDKYYESVSKQNVQNQVKELIANEDKSLPISDQDIVNILLERNISVSRRVVAKYRDAMNIPNSRERRK